MGDAHTSCAGYVCVGTGAGGAQRAVPVLRRQRPSTGGPRRPRECTRSRSRRGGRTAAGARRAGRASGAGRTVTAAATAAAAAGRSTRRPPAAAGPGPARRGAARRRRAGRRRRARRAAATAAAGSACASRAAGPVGVGAGHPGQRGADAAAAAQHVEADRAQRAGDRAARRAVTDVLAGGEDGVGGQLQRDQQGGDPPEAALPARQGVGEGEDGGRERGHRGQRQRDPGQQHVRRGGERHDECREQRRAQRL